MENKNRFWWGIVAVILLILIVIGLGHILGNKAEAKIKIGVVMPMTGARADAGEYTKNALSIFENEINNDKNREHKIEFLYEDSKYEPQTAVGGFKKLNDVDKVNYFIGPYGSSEVLAVAPIAEAAKKILITPGAQSDDISKSGDYIFRLIHNSAQEGPIFSKFVAQKMKSDTLPFLAINTAITDPYLKNFRPNFEAAGKRIGMVEKFDSKALDFRTELSKIKATNPTDIFLISAPKQAGIILREANELGIKAQFYNIGVEGPELITEAKGASEGLIYPYSYDNQSAEPRVKQFYQNYHNKFGQDPDTVAANSYDAAYLLSDCIEKNGDDVEKVKACLYRVKDYHGASGTFSIDPNGNAIKDIFIKTIKDGKFVRYTE